MTACGTSATPANNCRPSHLFRATPPGHLDVVALQPAIELKPGETQQRRGPRLVTMRALKRFGDRALSCSAIVRKVAASSLGGAVGAGIVASRGGRGTMPSCSAEIGAPFARMVPVRRPYGGART
jgi:hypothetical protein